MTAELKIVIENLYTNFSVYPLRLTMTGCACCFTEAAKEKIFAKTLRELNVDDLAEYVRKTMTTWGESEDFKHFLPRIFELLATTGIAMVDSFIVLEKLELAKWRTWPESEQKAIEEFLYYWWSELIKTQSYFDMEVFIAINKLTKNIDHLLDLWIISFEDNSFYNYVDLIYYYLDNLLNNSNKFQNINQLDTVKLLNWINSNCKSLEEGFFYFDSIDKNFAEKISITLDIYKILHG